jgi:hypothetical protein
VEFQPGIESITQKGNQVKTERVLIFLKQMHACIYSFTHNQLSHPQEEESMITHSWDQPIQQALGAPCKIHCSCTNIQRASTGSSASPVARSPSHIRLPDAHVCDTKPYHERFPVRFLCRFLIIVCVSYRERCVYRKRFPARFLL